MKMTVAHLDGQYFSSVSTGVKYTKSQLQALADSGFEIIYIFDFFDHV